MADPGEEDYRLDKQDEPIDPSLLSSIAMDGLVFAHMSGEYIRQYSASTLTNQHGLNRPLAYLVYGNKRGVNYYLGLEQEAMTHLCEKQEDALSSPQIREMIEPYLLNCGLINGTPDLPLADTDSISTSQMRRLANGLNGQRFGLLFLALPIKQSLIEEEIAITQSRLNSAILVENPDQKRKLRHLIEAQQQYLDELGKNIVDGYWLVGGYFFAPSRDTLIRLQSLLKASYCDTTRYDRYTTTEIPGISSHIQQFGILLNLQEEEEEEEENLNRIDPRVLLRYRFAETLNTSRLSAYING